MYTTAANGLGHPKCKNTDWFQEHEEEIQSLLAKKQKVHMQDLACDLQQNKSGFSPCQSYSSREDATNEKISYGPMLHNNNNDNGIDNNLQALRGPTWGNH